MHKNGWRPFWAALGAALLVLLPLVGGTVLLTRQMVRTRIQTAQPQSGVPIQLPRAEHRMTLLLCTAGEQPGFLLVYLNAAQNSLNLLAVPGELTVPFNGETASLAHCYGAAGPARCRQALLEVLGLPEDMLYLALSPAVLEKTASRYGPVRVGFSGALTADELAETELSAAVQSISAKEAHALLSGWDTDGILPPARRAAARGAHVLVFAGPGEEGVARDVIALSELKGNPLLHDLSCALTLPELAAYLRMLNCYVSNDSGPMHLAWAQHTPVTALFGPTVRELGFFPRGDSAKVFEVSLECRPCGLHGPHHCPKKHHRCMVDIDVEAVWRDVAGKLGV